MTRVLCLWFPNWPIQRRQQQSPALREQPLVLIRSMQGSEQVGHCCSLASRRGIRPEMSLAEARTFLQPRSGRAEVGQCLPEEPEQDQQALKQLAWDSEQFSPLVGLEQEETPESLVLDVTGCAVHFGGEQGLTQAVVQFCQTQAFSVRVGLADSFGAAWAAAHFGTKLQTTCILPPGEQEHFLRALPVSAFRLSSKTLNRLQQVGLRTVGQLLRISRSTLPSRFGAELIQRIDQALGSVPELIVAERRPEPLQETWESEDPFFDVAILELIVGDLLDRILTSLQPRGQGIKRLTWTLQGSDRRILTHTLELVQPSLQRRHLLSLMALQWEQMSLAGGIQQVHLCADKIEFLTARRQTLWELENDEASPSLHRLVETLSSRLGREAVLRPSLRADDQPELAFGLQPVIGEDRQLDLLQTTSIPHRHGRTRPLWLKREPIPVDVIARHRHGPPARFRWQNEDWTVHQSWGPERITTAWWRGPLVRRDYFQVECEQGQRFWLFRELVTGKWFLHAAFD
ncbi:Y-family DNA polymerase [Planctomicrobium sp. SH527]|uniref:Y-family DNA polymerase n=1 Tax=Planctomicrobium sp. SH527 TaxID=3448123 RepID=UPI003F5BB0A1